MPDLSSTGINNAAKIGGYYAGPIRISKIDLDGPGLDRNTDRGAGCQEGIVSRGAICGVYRSDVPRVACAISG